MKDTKKLASTESPSDIKNMIANRKVEYFKNSIGTDFQKLESLMRYMDRQNLAKLISLVDVFRMTIGVSGSIVNCGVYFGSSLMTWAKLSTAFEPYNYNCKILGFDTFEGNKGLSDKDISSKSKLGVHHTEGGYYADSYDDLLEAVEIFDIDRPLNIFKKVELIKGDLCVTAKQYIENNPELVVRILSLSVNLYEPTKAALNAFLPRMPKGSIIVPFTLNSDIYPGVTLSILEELGIRNYELRTFDYYSNVNYIIL
ncbi:MAG: class I SAM-dependent methyltransferase [Ignavibacteriae bacterium]|nr:class I SAM-dependent methyltransferase [Ignavibacteriota bacterium]